MKRVLLLIAFLSFFTVSLKPLAVIEGYDLISQSPEENIAIYAREWDGLYRDLKIDFKGTIYSRPYWINNTNPTYAPKIIYHDINGDKNEELIIILTIGSGTGIADQEVHVFDTHYKRFGEVLVDNPLAIISKNVKTKLSQDKAEIRIGDKAPIFTMTPSMIDPEHLFDDVSFGSMIRYAVKDNQLIVKLAGQISPAAFIGEIVIVYEYRDNMYQAKSIEYSEEYDW